MLHFYDAIKYLSNCTNFFSRYISLRISIASRNLLPAIVIVMGAYIPCLISAFCIATCYGLVSGGTQSAMFVLRPNVMPSAKLDPRYAVSQSVCALLCVRGKKCLGFWYYSTYSACMMYLHHPASGGLLYTSSIASYMKCK